MQGMSDHEFDALFKKAAENLEVPYNPKGWKRMQSRLNAGGTGFIRRGLWGLGALLLIFSTGWWLSASWIAGARQTEEVDITAKHTVKMKEEVPSLPEVSALPDAAALSPEAQAVEKSTKAKNAEVVDTPESTADRKTDIMESPTDNHQKAELSVIEIKMPDDLYFLQGFGIAQHTWKWAERSLMPVEGKELDSAGAANKAPQEIIKTNKHSVVNRWGLGFALSPDLSSVGLNNIHHVSTKVAFQLEFFVLSNISISSGVIFSNKIYDASAEDYHQTYSNNYVPSYINGQCKVLDVPLNIRWYALNREKSRFFISSGLSSYLMLSEDYEYVYASKGGSYTRDYGYKNKNNHLFKVANFSIGYTRALGKHWAVQAEPFVKLPLAGVGEGAIKLSTVGAFMSVQYCWGRRR